MSKLHKPVVVFVLALTAVLIAESAVLAATLGRNGKAVTAVRTVTNDAEYLNQSLNTWVDVPDMKTFVTVPALEKALLVITFSTSSMCSVFSDSSANLCHIRVLLDGNVVSPGDVEWGAAWFEGLPNTNPYPDEGARSMQWVAGPVSPGEHQVKVQAKVGVEGSLQLTGAFALREKTLTVLRSKM